MCETNGTPPTPPPVAPSGGQRIVAYAIACAAPLLTAGLYIHHMQAAGVAAGFPLDDSWIHAQYARTIAEGRPFEYVPGQRSIGTTSVLFDVVWAAASFVTREYVITIHALNVLLTMGVGAVIVALLLRYRIPPLTAGVGAALIVTGYPFPWSSLSGMETALATLLTTAAVLAHVTWGRRTGWRPLAGPVLMALAAIARPENLVLFPLSEVDRLLMRRRTGDRPRLPRPALRFCLRLAAFGMTMLPYVALNYAVHGAPVPNTFAAKVGRLGLAESLETEGAATLGARIVKAYQVSRDALAFIAGDDNALLLALALVGVAVLFLPRPRRAPAADSCLPLLAFLGGTAATGIVTLGLFFPGQSQRYLIQWTPLVLVFGVIGMDLVARLVSRLFTRSQTPVYAATIAALALLDVGLLARLYSAQADQYVQSVDNINDMQVALGRWVNEHTPPDAVIATNDIGAIAFFGNRPIVDTIGLIDPEVVRIRHLPHSTRAMMEYLESRSITHALLFPDWHPDLILDPHLQVVDRVVLEHNVICGDDRMLVMQADWSGTPARHTPPPWLDEEVRQIKQRLELVQAVMGGP